MAGDITRDDQALRLLTQRVINTEIRPLITQLQGRVARVPRARAISTVEQSVPNISHTAIAFGAEEFDVGDMHSTSTNSERLTISTPGAYEIKAHASFASNGTGSYRWTRILKNGTTELDSVNGPPSAGARTIMEVGTCVELAAGDYVTLVVYQDSGGSLGVAGNLSAFLIAGA